MSLFAGRDLVCLRGQRLVFHGLGFAVGPGEALLLVGPNGSGKSSLLRLMAGLLRPAAGTLFRDDRPVAEDPEGHRRSLHFLGHADAVKPVFSVIENLQFWMKLRGAPRYDGYAPAWPADPRAALDQFAIEPLADLPARLLSAGQRRRLALARLLAVPAPLWLLDEPTTALDAASVGRFAAAVAAHRAAGGAVVLSSHGEVGVPSAAPLSLADFTPRAAGAAAVVGAATVPEPVP